MKLTRLAILARFKGNYGDAIQYCEDVARVYPHLRGEYRQHRESLLDLAKNLHGEFAYLNDLSEVTI